MKFSTISFVFTRLVPLKNQLLFSLNTIVVIVPAMPELNSFSIQAISIKMNLFKAKPKKKKLSQKIKTSY